MVIECSLSIISCPVSETGWQFDVPVSSHTQRPLTKVVGSWDDGREMTGP
jgi:hypothetical protein